MNLEKLLEFRVLPILGFKVRVKVINPFFSAFDLRAVKALFSKLLGNLIPFFRNELGIEFTKEFKFLNRI